ncbi:MAG: methyltransferase domain-containing protein [Candidatus Krumholzibacteriota bacterium]|nr:methyltransferase domain-containing protein [Candidatus Krumholzibacteriota bacterium]
MKRLISRILPASLKHKIRQSSFSKHRQANQLASSSKRIDICAAQFAHILHLSKYPSLEGKVCAEIGAGWVLSHTLVCYLLGAKRIIATDIKPNAYPESLSLSLKGAISSIPRDILAPFSDHSLIRERYNRLLSVTRFDLDKLKDFGIEYKSPVDLAVEKLNTSVDFIYSNAVLEHVPSDDVSALLNNLVNSLNPDGRMIHCIHLEDHKDINGYPFEFLTIPRIEYTRKLQSDRGNRIRLSEWQNLFGNLTGWKSDFIYRYSRIDEPLPDSIDPSISYSDEADLRTSHIGVYTRKE